MQSHLHPDDSDHRSMETDAALPEIFRVSPVQLAIWLDTENLRNKVRRTLIGVEITNSIDGNLIEGREVSFARLSSQGNYPQHIHRQSDARFYIVSGSGVLLTGKERRAMKAGDVVDIPRGMPHGFELKEGEQLTFVSVQSPPIRDPHTGEEDLHLTDLV